MGYKIIQSDNFPDVSELIWTVFCEYVAPGYSPEGIDTFKRFIHPDELKNLLINGRFYIAGCFDGAKLVGVIAMRDFSHVSLLFVDKAYHRKGIAKALFNKAVHQCLEANPELDEITVNSSPYAVEVYFNMGFETTGEETITDGITFTPMKIVLAKLV